MYLPRIICPLCGSIEDIIKWGRNKQKRTRYMCLNCKKTFCNRTGTIRLRSRIADKKWKELVPLISLRTHPSGADLGRLLNQSSRAGQQLMKKVRQIMPKATGGTISGIAELDETTFRGQWIGGARQRKGGLKLTPLPNRNMKTMNSFVDRLVSPQATVFTDEWGGYLELGLKRNHYTVCHAKEFVSEHCKSVHTNSIEGVWGHAKPLAWHTYRGYPNLNDFLREICFQFNFNYTERCNYLNAQFSRLCLPTNT
jgi:transposase-like protein